MRMCSTARNTAHLNQMFKEIHIKVKTNPRKYVEKRGIVRIFTG